MTGLLAAFAEVSYVHALLHTGSYARALVELSAELRGLLGGGAVETILLPFAAGYAARAFARGRRMSLLGQIGVSTSATLLVFAWTLAGYRGLPQVPRVVGSASLDPIAGTHLYVVILGLGALLPLVSWAFEPERLGRLLRAST